MSDADRIAALERMVTRLGHRLDQHGSQIDGLELNLGNTTRALGAVEATADELADRLDQLEANLADTLRDAATRRDLTGGQG